MTEENRPSNDVNCGENDEIKTDRDVTGGDKYDLRDSQGAIIKPTGPIVQNFTIIRAGSEACIPTRSTLHPNPDSC